MSSFLVFQNSLFSRCDLCLHWSLCLVCAILETWIPWQVMDGVGGENEAGRVAQKRVIGWASQLGGRSGPFVSTSHLFQRWHFIPKTILQLFSDGVCRQDSGSLSENFHWILLSGVCPSSEGTASLLPDLALGAATPLQGEAWLHL